MKRHIRGITLIETIVVVVIVATLAAILTFAILPRAKRGGIETRIRADLRQIATAITIYRADYDDSMPLRMASLPATTPKEYPNWPKSSDLCPGCNVTKAYYMLNYTWRMQQIARHYNLGVEFDEQVNAIADAPFYQVPTGTEYEIPFPTKEGWVYRKHPLVRILGVRTDGSIFWKPYRDEWEIKTGFFITYPLPK